jgi:cell division septation protein DedD
VLIIIFFILIGCFYVPGSSNHYSKNQSNISNRHISRFFSKVRPSSSHIESQYRYAIHLQKIGKHRISVEVLKDIARYDPGNPRIYNALGISYDIMADFEKANQAYQTALKLDPGLDYVHNNLGYSQLLQKDYEGAKKSFRLAISSAGKNSDVSKYENNLALANSKSGTPDEAVSKNEEVESVPVASLTQETDIVANDDVEQPQADITTIEETVQVPQDAIDPAPEVNLAAVDTTALHWEDDRASADLSDLEKNNIPHLPDNSNPDNSNIDVAESEAASEKEVYSVQVGAMRQLKNAERLKRILSDEVENIYISKVQIQGKRYYRVRVGPFKNKLDAEDTIIRLKSVQGVKGFTFKTPIKPRKHFYSVQMGAMRQLNNAEKLKRILSDEVENIYISKVQIQGRRYYRVRVGPFKDKVDAENTRSRLKSVNGIKGFIVYQSLGAHKYNRVKIDETITKGDLSDYKASIEVSNGNGINRMARRVGNFLSQKGLKIIRLTNAIAFNFQKTIIYFTKGYRDEAVYVENQFPGDQIIEEVQTNNRPGIQIKIVIGDDLRPHDRKLFVSKFQTDRFASKETQYIMAGGVSGG